MRTKAVHDSTLTKIEDIFREEFPNDTVDVSLSGVRDNIHVIVVSRKFDRFRAEKKKQEYLWGLVDASGLSEEDKQRITLIMPMSPAELVH